MALKAVLLDTSFFLRFLNESDPLCKNAEGYYRYFLEQGSQLYISTISIAEYCVGGSVNELPLKDVQVVPFNINHAKRAGDLAGIVFKKRSRLVLQQRNIIPNDTKLFAQADIESSIGYYLSSDTESKKIYDLLNENAQIRFHFIDLRNPYNEVFGVLDL